MFEFLQFLILLIGLALLVWTFGLRGARALGK